MAKITKTTLVAGSLGVGKTTTLLELFKLRPPDEHWAVLVNEFGRIGIDDAVLDVDGISVTPVPGGCICCSAGVELRVALVRLLRAVKPDRLLIEPTGLARPSAVIDILRSPGIEASVELGAVIGLIDPRKPPNEDDELQQELLDVADLVVLHRQDQAAEQDLVDWEARLAALQPAKLEVIRAQHGQVPARWLELEASPREHEHVHHHAGELLWSNTSSGLGAIAASDAGETAGWVFPVDQPFDRRKMESCLQQLVRPNPALREGVLRCKALLRTQRWLRLDATSTEMRWTATTWRRDSRIEFIVPAGSEPDWETVERLLLEAR